VFADYRLAVELGYEPSKKEWADHMHMPIGELVGKLEEAEFARDKMVMANLRLVVSVTKRYHSYGLEMADLIQVSVRAVRFCLHFWFLFLSGCFHHGTPLNDSCMTPLRFMILHIVVMKICNLLFDDVLQGQLAIRTGI
jgi:hypothetical protein